MREGIEKLLFDKFCELLQKNNGNPRHALDSLDYLIFMKHKDEFYSLSEDEQMEIRHYIHVLAMIHKADR